MTNTCLTERPGAAPRDEPLLRSTQRYADEVLRPTALQTDRDGVSAARIAELASLGLLNHLAPHLYGGADLDRTADRLLHESIAGGCFNTWLVWAQHAPLVGRLAAAAADGAALPRWWNRRCTDRSCSGRRSATSAAFPPDTSVPDGRRTAGRWTGPRPG